MKKKKKGKNRWTKIFNFVFFFRDSSGDGRERAAVEIAFPEFPSNELESGSRSGPGGPRGPRRLTRKPTSDVGQPAGFPEPAQFAAAATVGHVAAESRGRGRPTQSPGAVFPTESG